MKASRLLIIFSIILPTFLLQLRPISAVNACLTPTSQPTTQPTTNSLGFIRSSCNSTLYPDICYNSLAGYSSTVKQNPGQLARVAIGVTLSKAKHMAAHVANLTRQADYGADHRSTAALHDCLSNFGDAVEEIYGSLKQMRQLGSAGASKESLRFQMSNVQTWMSAALTDEDTCTDGFEDVSDGPLKADVCERTVYVKKLTSNALALVNSFVDKVMNG